MAEPEQKTEGKKGSFSKKAGPVAPSKPTNGFSKSTKAGHGQLPTVNPVEESINSKIQAEILQAPTAKQQLANIQATMALTYGNLGLIPYNKEQIQAQVGLIGIQTEVAKVDLQGKTYDLETQKLNAKMAGIGNWFVDTVLFSPLNKEVGRVSSLNEQAVEFRRNGNIEAAEKAEQEAASLGQQVSKEATETFRPLDSAMKLGIMGLTPVINSAVPGAGNLYGTGMPDNSAAPPTKRIVK